MDINNNSSLHTFKAIRIVKCSNAEYNQLSQLFGEVLERNGHILFKNRSVSDIATYSQINKTAANMNYSKDWVFENCRQNNINLPNIDTCPLYDFTGIDVLKLAVYKLKELCRSFKHLYITMPGLNNTPSYLHSIKTLNDNAEKCMPAFIKFLQKNNAKEIQFDDFMKELKQQYLKNEVIGK